MQRKVQLTDQRSVVGYGDTRAPGSGGIKQTKFGPSPLTKSKGGETRKEFQEDNGLTPQRRSLKC